MKQSTSLGWAALAVMATLSGCSKSAPPSNGNEADPAAAAFANQWRSLSTQEVFYIENDGGQGLMGRVPRAGHLPEKAGFNDSPTEGADLHPVRPPVPHVSGPVAAVGAAKPGGPIPESLSHTEVSSVVRRNLGGVRVCYLKLARTGSGVSGRAIVSFSVEPAGKAGQVRVDSPVFRDTSLPDCVSQQVKQWSFPQTQKGGATVQYPLVFVGS